MPIDLEIKSKDVSTFLNSLIAKGEMETLLDIYKNNKINVFVKDEVELAIFKTIDVCLSKQEFDKIKLLLKDPDVNGPIRFAAEIAYNKKCLCGCYDKGVISEIPASLKKCKGNCKCKTLKEKVNQTRN